MAERSVNQVTLLGRLGKDAETKFLANGTACTKFSLATTRRWKQGEEWKEATDWHNVILWRSEQLGSYLTKGKQVYVQGRIETRSYEKDGEKRYATEIVADNVILLGGREAGEQPVSAPRSARPAPVKDDGFNGMGVSEDDIDSVPF